MHSRPFRGLLASAALLAGLGVDLTPPPREPEPTQAELDALLAQLAAANIDGLALLERCGGYPAEFMRQGLIELAARDLAQQGVMDIAGARDVLEHMSQLPDEAKFDMLDRLGSKIQRHAEKPRLEITGVGGTAGYLEVKGRRGPGLQLRDERERVGEPLRILAQYTGMTSVELGEIERGLRVPTPAQWAALQDALPELGEMEAPPTEAERSPVLTVGELREGGVVGLPEHYRPGMRMQVIDRLLHPAGRCTCFGEGECAWCKETARKEAEEQRAELARLATKAARQARRTEQRETQKAKARKTKRRGW